MQIEKKFFPKVMRHNDELYFAHLQGVLEAVDELATMAITKHSKHYSFRIAPSIPSYTNSIIEELFKFHNQFGIKLDMSKSIKTSAIISFDIDLG
jgi:hypothetical protein